MAYIASRRRRDGDNALKLLPFSVKNEDHLILKEVYSKDKKNARRNSQATPEDFFELPILVIFFSVFRVKPNPDKEDFLLPVSWSLVGIS